MKLTKCTPFCVLRMILHEVKLKIVDNVGQIVTFYALFMPFFFSCCWSGCSFNILLVSTCVLLAQWWKIAQNYQIC